MVGDANVLGKLPVPVVVRGGGGGSGGAMVLGKLTVPGRPTNYDNSRARAYCTCSRCRWGCLDIFTLVYPFSPLFPLFGRRPDID